MLQNKNIPRKTDKDRSKTKFIGLNSKEIRFGSANEIRFLKRSEYSTTLYHQL